MIKGSSWMLDDTDSAYSFSTRSNKGGISAIDFFHFTINPCNLRIFNPNMGSNYDVYRSSLDHPTNKCKDVLVLIFGIEDQQVNQQ